jgi:DHA2 family multidrug resistance protein-like MFS transporter
VVGHLRGRVALGPVVGGALLEVADWQALFAINVPIVLVAFVATLLVVPESRNPNPGPFDPVAAPLSIAGMVGLVWGIKEGAKSGFLEAPVIAALAIGVLLLAVFVRRQWRSTSPIVDVQLFRDRRFAGAALAVLLGFLALGALLLFITQFLQLVQGLTPLEAGLRMLPVALAAAAAAPLTSGLVERAGPAVVVGGGLALIATMLGVLTGLRADTSAAAFLVPLVVTGVGFGLVSTAASSAIMTLAPAERAGGAAAVQETAYELGAALGVAVFGSVLAARYRTALELPDDVPGQVAEAVEEGLPAASVAAEQLGPQGAQVLLAAQEAFMAAFDDTMVVAAVTMGVAAVVIWGVLLGSGRRGRGGRARRTAPVPSGRHAGTST